MSENTPRTADVPEIASAGRRFQWKGLVPLTVLILLIGVISLKQPAFLGLSSLQAVAIQAAPLLLLGVGLTPVVLIGGLDLSVAALASLCSVVLGYAVPAFGILGVLMVLVGAAAAGALVGWIHAVAQVPSFIVTLGAMGLYTGLALWVSNATNQPLGRSRIVIDWLNYFVAQIPMSFITTLVALIVVGLVLRFGTIGRYILAIGSGERAAVMSGVSGTGVRVWAYALSGLCAGLASCVLVAETGFASPSLAQGLLVPVIASVMIGGTVVTGGAGSVWRTLIGVLVVAVLQSGLVVIGLDPVISDLIFGVAIVVALALTTGRSTSQVVK